jgi:hypothetical protein
MVGTEAFVDGAAPAPRIPSEDKTQWYLEAQGGALDGHRAYLDDGQSPSRPPAPDSEN